MKNKGFTIIELLGVVALLAAIMLLIYPTVLEKIQEKDDDILDKKEKLVYTAAYDYLYENKNIYPISAGEVYCINMGYLSYLDKLPIDKYEDLLKDPDISKNYIQITIGTEDNLYRIVTSTSACTADNII